MSGERLGISAFELGLVALTALAILVPGLWAYTLIDPWEGHYAEVARRILEEGDWVLLRWQDQLFQSKPALTPWLIAASMKVLGVAEGGGYSGELVSSARVVFAVRLPFALCGAFGIVITWYAVARLAGRRVAWIALLVLGTTPFYLLIARQAITDIPMVACLMGAVACFALASEDAGAEPLRPLWRRLGPQHLALGLISVLVGSQALYYVVYFGQFPGVAHGLRVPAPGLVLALPMVAAVAGLWFWSLWLQPVRTRRQAYMLWFYLFIGVSILAKGPPAVAVAGGTCLLYLIVTRRWRLLLEVEIPRGIVIVVAVALPWHVAMFFKAGMGYYNEYVHLHLLGRAFEGVHGDRGTFGYYASQLGIGMWPWSALLPAAIAGVFAGRLRGSAGHLRVVAALWAAFAVAMYCLVQTKFHHYIFPAVPALALLVAFFLDDLLARRVSRAALASLIAVPIVLLIARDLVADQKQIIGLFIYLPTERPWPSGPPWNVDLGGAIVRFAALFAVAFALLAWARVRWGAFAGLAALALVWALWVMNAYMQAAAPHWGQRELHRTYYRERAIHGVDIHYGGLRELADDWGAAAPDYEVRTRLPDDIPPGQGVTARLHLPGEDEPVALEGWISRLGDDLFSIRIPDDERAAIRELVVRGRGALPSRAPPRVEVDADRLIAWQLNWRAENFWSGGEIWSEEPEMQTVFHSRQGGHGGDEAFLTYLEEHGREGQTYFVITGASRTRRLESLLPTREAKRTLDVRDGSSNKYALLSFTL